MILCVVDDLLFQSKLTTTAAGVGRELAIVRVADQVIPRIRETRPSLVILDLNRTSLRPLDAIAAMKADAGLRDIRTLGYVSHVDSDTIAAARAAGVGEVLARSAFVTKLADILAGAL